MSVVFTRLFTALSSATSVFLIMLGLCYHANAQVFVGGELSQNTTFTKAKNPYIVFQDLIVPTGITLTIEPGTEIRFSSETRLKVNGILIAKGSESDSIRFIMNNQIPNVSLWNGLVFDSTRTVLDEQGDYLSGTIVSYATIYNTNYSVTITGNAGILMEHTLILKSGYGIYVNDASNNHIIDCQILETGFGIFIPSGVDACNNIFENNRIRDNINIGLLINNSSGRIHDNIIRGNEITNNYIGLYVGNDGPVDIGKNVIQNNIISGNTFEGARIYQDSTLFIGNHILDNEMGVTLKHTDQSIISGNIFSGNKLWALQLSDSTTNTLVELNNINRNGKGILITQEENYPSVNNSFLHNTVYQNGLQSFRIESSPQGLIHFNNLYLNGDTNSFVNLTQNLIEAEFNWWGFESTSKIDSIIYDNLDNSALGLVKYHQALSQADTIAPILPPRNVVKRQVGEDVLVSWDAAPVADLKGYFVHFGTFDGEQFSNTLDVGNVEYMILPSFSVLDSIAVSAFDSEADSLNDRVEGHESEYVMALMGPYAGADTTICLNSSLLLQQATAFNYQTVNWSTSGDGLFSDPNTLQPIYIPGTQDFQEGMVILTMNAIGVGFNLHDQLRLYFSHPPVAFAGNDTLILHDSVFRSVNAITGETGTIKWTTSGDGVFDNDSILITTYTPGAIDIAKGKVTLTLMSNTPCGVVSDDIEVVIHKSCSIHGRVHAWNQLCGSTELQMFTVRDSKISPFRSTLSTTDGYFSFKNITPGEYLLYAMPDKNVVSDYAPTYYFNKLYWEHAYQIPVVDDTYDIDIDLQKFSAHLPEGEGIISGLCSSTGSSGSECSGIVVLLYDKTTNYLLGWTLVGEDGLFSFPGLPYGDYMIVGEKAGYERFFSQIISLSPEHPVAGDIQLHIEPFKISFVIPEITPGTNTKIQVYPNPAQSRIYFKNLPTAGLYRLVITGSDGKSNHTSLNHSAVDPCEFDISFLPPGLFLLRIYSEDVLLKAIRIIKN